MSQEERRDAPERHMQKGNQTYIKVRGFAFSEMIIIKRRRKGNRPTRRMRTKYFKRQEREIKVKKRKISLHHQSQIKRRERLVTKRFSLAISPLTCPSSERREILKRMRRGR